MTNSTEKEQQTPADLPWRPHSLGGGYIPHPGETLGFGDGYWLVTAVDADGFNYKPKPACPTCGQWTFDESAGASASSVLSLGGTP
jgi:hypothetical protein